MLNRDVEPALNALAAVMKKQLPIPIAMRMADCRRALEARVRDNEDFRQACVARHKSYTDKDGLIKSEDLSPMHPNWAAARDEIEELFATEIEPPDTFELFVKSVNGEEQFCWTEGFKTAKFSEFDGDMVYGLKPLLNIKYVD